MRRWVVGRQPGAAEIAEVAALLRDGGVVLLPTDTIYGLHAVATNEAACARIAELKEREATKPFVVLGASLEQLLEVGLVVDARDREALNSIWPAPLTAILPLQRPIAASRGASSLAVRVPDLEWLRGLVAMTGPLASTSANRSGEPPIESPDSLARDLQNALDGVVDAGPLSGEPSTIVDFTGDEPRLIREGDRFFTQKVWKTLRKSL
jgi:tRNA threonylcarbamoyl adenosine modification protein (Sua5/YciO/YrdC/YwlC family)